MRHRINQPIYGESYSSTPPITSTTKNKKIHDDTTDDTTISFIQASWTKREMGCLPGHVTWAGNNRRVVQEATAAKVAWKQQKKKKTEYFWEHALQNKSQNKQRNTTKLKQGCVHEKDERNSPRRFKFVTHDTPMVTVIAQTNTVKVHLTSMARQFPANTDIAFPRLQTVYWADVVKTTWREHNTNEKSSYHTTAPYRSAVTHPHHTCTTIVHSKKTEPWQPQLVGWYERRPLHDPNKVFAYWSKKKMTTFGAKTTVLFKNLGTGCCSQPLPSEHRCVWPLKVLLSCYWAFSGFMAVIFQGGVVG